MIKHSDFDFSYDYLRFDTSWKFEWSYDDMNGQKLYPFIDAEGNKTWYFNNETFTGGTPQVDVWDASAPYLQYDANSPETWDSRHPENTTRYLAPGNSLITLTNSIEAVVIDNVPPAFVSDAGTDYIWIKTSSSADAARHCEFVFRDEVGLDFKQFEVSVGKTSLIRYNRKEHKEEVSGYIAAKSLHIKSDGYQTYKIEFTTSFGSTQQELEQLTSDGLTVKIWDLAGNCNTYTFRKKTDVDDDSIIDRSWILIASQDELNALRPCVIDFYDKDPNNMIVNENAEGGVWCSVYNPNKDFWVIPIAVQLSDTSVGTIDVSTYDDSEYEKTGTIRFKIDKINKRGKVTLEAWLETGNKNFDDVLKTSTYASADCGPWIVMDADGRLYDIQRYVPKYLRKTDYGKFVEFFALYLNTIYTNVSKGTNISILEKIAEINDFNDLDRIESMLLWHFANSHGMEFDVNLETLKAFDPAFFNMSEDWQTSMVSKTDEDVLDIVRYALKNLPFYNQIKGTEQGMIFALKMFSLSCKIINLWVKMEPQVEENPDLIEENALYDFTSYFLTSRFNIDFTGVSSVDFETFNSHIGSFIKLIESIKPITKILNLIKFAIKIDDKKHMYANDDFSDDAGANNVLEYTITWDTADAIEDILDRTRYNAATNHITRTWFPFKCTSCEVTGGPNLGNIYTLMCSLLADSNYKFAFTIDGKKKTFDITLARFGVLDTGFYIVPTDGGVATDLVEFINMLKTDGKHTIIMKIKHIPGTKMIYCEE